ncbi:hypothetical protein ACFQX7_07190 [Luedemannella flava]
MRYQITVTNLGPATATAVQARDDLPAALGSPVLSAGARSPAPRRPGVGHAGARQLGHADRGRRGARLRHPP